MRAKTQVRRALLFAVRILERRRPAGGRELDRAPLRARLDRAGANFEEEGVEEEQAGAIAADVDWGGGWGCTQSK